MALLDLLGRRWALRVLWELRDGGSCTFRELQDRCGGVSSSVLSDRLRELREAQIVGAEAAAGGYRLTGHGRELLSALEPISAWAKGWAERTEDRSRAEL
jgi:DNA-binding HxlR family transcriptional regulator